MKEKSNNYHLKVVVQSCTAVVTFGFFHHKQQPTKWWVLYRTVCSPFQMLSSSVSVGIAYICAWHNLCDKGFSDLVLPFSPHRASWIPLGVLKLCRLLNFC